MAYTFEEREPYLTSKELRAAADLLDQINELSKTLVLSKSEVQLAAGVPLIDSSGEYCGVAVHSSDHGGFVFQMQEEE